MGRPLERKIITFKTLDSLDKKANRQKKASRQQPDRRNETFMNDFNITRDQLDAVKRLFQDSSIDKLTAIATTINPHCS